MSWGFSPLLAAAASGRLLDLDFTTGALPGGVTLTRASAGTRINVSGVLVSETTDVARFDYTTGIACLLVEPASTNLATIDQTSASFTANGGGASKTTGLSGSPDGTSTNVRWTLNPGLGVYATPGDAVNITNGSTYSVSSWLAKGGTTGLVKFVYLQDDFVTWRDVTDNSAPTAFNDLSLSAVLTRRSTTFTLQHSASLNFSMVGFSTDITGTIDTWGWQYEARANATSYMAPGTSRAADVCTITIPAGVEAIEVIYSDDSTQLFPVTPSSSFVLPTATMTGLAVKKIQDHAALVYFYKGAQARATAYKGIKTDVQIYRGSLLLFP